MGEKLRILILEDVPADAELAERELQKAGMSFVANRVQTREDFLQQLEDFTPDLLLLDYQLPQFDGMSALKLAQERLPHVPVVMFTASINEETAVDCITAGAADYVLKDHLARLAPAVEGALERKREREARKRAEQALRESEERFRAVAESASDAIVIADAEGNITFWNDAAVAIFGYSREEVTGKPLTMLMPQRYRRAHRAALNGFKSTRESRMLGTTVELVGLRKDGSEFPLDMSLSEWKQGRTESFCGIIRDISERKQAQETLRTSEERLRILFESAPDAVYLNDLKGTFVDGNRAAEELVGYSKQELIGENFLKLKLLSHDQLPRAAALLAKNALGKPTGPDEFVLTRKDGRRAAVEIRTFPVTIQGRHLVLAIARDVTERKEADELVERLSRRNELILHSAGEGIFGVDQDGKTTFVNAAASKMLGRSVSNLLGQRIHPLVHHTKPDGTPLPSEKCSLLAAVRDGKEHRDETVFWRKDGTGFPVRCVSTAIQVGDQTLGAVMVFEDISERKRAEEAMRLSEERYRTLVERLPDGVYRSTPAGKYLEVNPAMVKMLGYDSKEELMAVDIKSQIYFDPDDRETIIRKQQETGQISEFRHRRKDGSVIWVEDSGDYVYDDAGEVLYHEGVLRDVTERKRAEEALCESEANYRALFEQATYGIYRSTADGRFLAVNPAVVEMLGYDSAEQVLQLDLARDVYVDPDERPKLIRAYRDSQQVRGAEVQWKHKQGQHITVRLSGRPVRDETGKLEAFEMMVEDVTERRALEAQLRQAQKMEAIGQLTGGIAHDFNNELSVMLLNAQLVAAALEQGREAQLSDIQDIEDAAQRAAAMTAQLLGFSRQAELMMKPTDLSRVVSSLSPMLRRLLPETIDIPIAADGPVRAVQVDATAVEQMLLNLATNARDAMPDGGTLRIEVEETELDEAYCDAHSGFKPGVYTCISTSDTGTGMDQETRARIFEPFFTTKAAGTGTGLGMAMVYGLTKQQGGFISVYSEVGQGTTIRLHFPVISQEPQRVSVRDSAAKIRGGVETILLVEDEDGLRRAGRRALEQYGYTVLTAADGEEALQVYQKRHEEIDLVVSDLVMPKISGVQLYEALSEDGEEVKFILASGYTGQETSARSELDHAVPFVQKPWKLTELLVRVRKILDEKTEARTPER